MKLIGGISFQDKLFFTKHLSVMVRSGIPLPEAISSLGSQSTNPTFKKVINKIVTHVSEGEPLAKALEKADPDTFDSLYRHLVMIGEESGTLEKNLEHLSHELAKAYEFKKKVNSAMLYPALVIGLGLFMGSGLAIFVLPQFANLFTSMGVDLPITTKILIFIASAFKSYGFAIIGTIFAISFIFNRIVQLPPIKPSWHRFLLSVPIFGPFQQKAQISDFSRNLGLMLTSGVPITQALSVITEATSNKVYQKYWKDLETAVNKGTSVGEELAKAKYKFVPGIVSKMASVGEKSGKLDETMSYLGEFFEEEVDQMAKDLPTILEPVLLVVVALIVLFLALAIITPIYDLTSSVRK